MNNERRKQIINVSANLQILLKQIENLRDDEQNYYDNIPENLINSQNACNSENAIDYLEEAIEQIEEAIEQLEDSAV